MDVLAAMLPVLKFGEKYTIDELMNELSSLARNATGIPLWLLDWVGIEEQATTLRAWQPMVVPGLLQTADYARSQFSSPRMGGDIEMRVEARVNRQEILYREGDPVHLGVLLAERVLSNRVGTAATMTGQIQHLAGWQLGQTSQSSWSPTIPTPTLVTTERSRLPACRMAVRRPISPPASVA